MVVEEMVESRHEANLATSLYILLYTQQIINPLNFLYSGVCGKVRQSFDSLAPACVLRYKARLSSLDYKLLGNSLFKSMKYKEAIIKYELALKWRWR